MTCERCGVDCDISPCLDCWLGIEIHGDDYQPPRTWRPVVIVKTREGLL